MAVVFRMVSGHAPIADATWRPIVPGGLHAAQTTHRQNLPSPGGYASLVTSPVSELHHLPDSLGYEAAVTLIGTGAITLDFLDQVAPAPEDVLLVLSAAGGIGRLAVPHVRRLGTTVVGAAGGPAKTATVRGLGADLAVDYDRPGWSEEVRAHFGTARPVTAVLDGVGGTKAAEAYGLLADGGRLVTIGCASGEWFVPDSEEAAARSGYGGPAPPPGGPPPHDTPP
ncbi:zinc-binding dehydrogenase, partial [Streptomyces albidoflavus]